VLGEDVYVAFGQSYSQLPTTLFVGLPVVSELADPCFLRKRLLTEAVNTEQRPRVPTGRGLQAANLYESCWLGKCDRAQVRSCGQGAGTKVKQRFAFLTKLW